MEHGYKCCLAFVIQVPGVKTVLPNIETHPEFGKALEEAKASGVEVLFLQCIVNEDCIVSKIFQYKKTPSLQTENERISQKPIKDSQKKFVPPNENRSISLWFVPRECVGTKLIYLAAQAVQI